MNGCPLDYSLCRDTVTLYRKQESGVLRQVVENCFLSWEEKSVTDHTGSRMGRNFLLILPGGEHDICLGDRIFDGIGPEIGKEDWGKFIPACVPGLGQVNYVTPCRWEGELCHTEAGHHRTAQPQL